jgi:3-phosphoshikimate 1-carboxyvinyltransferase
MSVQMTPEGALRVSGPQPALSGEVRVPGDKSISHRALILGAIASGTTRVRNFLPANDCLATLQAVRALGVAVEQVSPDELLVHGVGLHGLREPSRPIECGGSGTTMRLLAGLLAGQTFNSVLVGNEQLSRRPMDRVVIPLREMGAEITGRDVGRFAPLSITGRQLRGIDYHMPVASAQVKSAVLLSGLFAEGGTTVYEPLGMASRDHTERMLAAMGAELRFATGAVGVAPPRELKPLDLRVPGDISSAAFLLVAALIVPGSRVLLPSVGVNPGRTGILWALTRRMGGRVALHNERMEGDEPVADLEVTAGALKSPVISPESIPSMIDELPILAVAATQARGVTEVRGAAELRVKETDRIATTVAELRSMGAKIEALPDGFRVQGPTPLRGATVSSHGDHRLAMALAVAGLVADGETLVQDAECAQDSFPGFAAALASLTAAGVQS